MTDEEDVLVLRALDLWKSLREIVVMTHIPARRCRSILQRLRRRGLVTTRGRLWRGTPDGKKFLEDVETGKSAQERRGDRAPHKSIQEQVDEHARRAAFDRSKSALIVRAEAGMRELRATTDDCRFLPLASPRIPQLVSHADQLEGVAEVLKRITEERALEEARQILEGLLAQTRSLVTKTRAGLEPLRGLQFVDEDWEALSVRVKCNGCGKVQTFGIFDASPSEPPLRCQNPACRNTGKVRGRPPWRA